MKRLFSVLLAFILLISLTACGGKTSGTAPETPPAAQEQPQQIPDQGKTPEKVP